MIDSNLLTKYATHNCTLQLDLSNCKFPLSPDFKQSCFVAKIKEDPNIMQDDVHIKLNYNNQKNVFIAGVVLTVLLPTAMVAIVIVVIVVIVVARKKTQ